MARDPKTLNPLLYPMFWELTISAIREATRLYFDPLTSFGRALQNFGSQTWKFQREIALLQKARLKDTRKDGILDGKKGIPSAEDSAVSQAERKMREVYQADIRLGQQRFESTLQTYHIRYKQQFDRLVSLKKDYDEAKREWERQCSIEARSTLSTPLPWRVYLIIFAIIAFGEVPLNSLIFPVFRETRLMTMVIAATIALGIPLLAHFVGVWLKQHNSIEHAYKKALIGTAITVLGLAAMAAIRYSYFLYTTGEGTLIHSAAFFFINVAVFSVAAAASMFSHDESWHFEGTYFELVKKEKRWQKQSGVVTSLIEIHDGLLENFQGLENYIEAKYFEAVNEYRNENRRTREDRRAPPCWGSENSSNILAPEFHFRHFEELDVTKVREFLPSSIKAFTRVGRTKRRRDRWKAMWEKAWQWSLVSVDLSFLWVFTGLSTLVQIRFRSSAS